MIVGGWQIEEALEGARVDSRAYCRVPRGANLSMLPKGGGKVYVGGNAAAWDLWCVIHCGCKEHVENRRMIAREVKARR